MDHGLDPIDIVQHDSPEIAYELGVVLIVEGGNKQSAARNQDRRPLFLQGRVVRENLVKQFWTVNQVWKRTIGLPA